MLIELEIFKEKAALMPFLIYFPAPSQRINKNGSLFHEVQDHSKYILYPVLDNAVRNRSSGWDRSSKYDRNRLKSTDRYSFSRSNRGSSSSNRPKNRPEDWTDPWMRSNLSNRSDKSNEDEKSDKRNRPSYTESSKDTHDSMKVYSSTEHGRNGSFSSGSKHSLTSSDRENTARSSKRRRRSRRDSGKDHTRSDRNLSERANNSSSGSTSSPIKRRNGSPQHNSSVQTATSNVKIEMRGSKAPILATTISSSPIKGYNGTDRPEVRLRDQKSLSTSQNDTYRVSSNEKSTNVGIETKTENGSTGGKSKRIKSEPNIHKDRGNKRPINMVAQPLIASIVSNYGDNHSNDNVQSQYLNSENNDSYVPLKFDVNKKTGTIRNKRKNIHLREGNSVNDTESSNNNSSSGPTPSPIKKRIRSLGNHASTKNSSNVNRERPYSNPPVSTRLPVQFHLKCGLCDYSTDHENLILDHTFRRHLQHHQTKVEMWYEKWRYSSWCDSIPARILLELEGKFISNIAEKHMSNNMILMSKMCEAYWYFMKTHYQLGYIGRKHFVHQLFNYIPYLRRPFYEIDEIYAKHTYFKLTVPSIGAVIFNESLSKVMIVRDFKGRWTFPCGKLEVDETDEECATREVEEECGIQISGKIKKELYLHNWWKTYWEQRFFPKYIKLFLIKGIPEYTKATISNQYESNAVIWASLEFLSDPNLANFMIHDFLPMIKKWIKENK